MRSRRSWVPNGWWTRATRRWPRSRFPAGPPDSWRSSPRIRPWRTGSADWSRRGSRYPPLPRAAGGGGGRAGGGGGGGPRAPPPPGGGGGGGGGGGAVPKPFGHQ